MSSSELEEFSLIERLTRDVSHFENFDIIGPGDDCAVLPIPGDQSKKLLLTTDALVESVHFNPSFSSWVDIGWKSLAVSLSDIAAMGGKAECCLVSLQVRDSLRAQALEEIYRGIYQLGDQCNVQIVGGDTVSALQLSITTTVLGTCLGLPILRSGAEIDDDVWVSGNIGSAAAGLAIFKNEIDSDSIKDADVCIEAHRQPKPCLKLAQGLKALNSINAMIDISDGLFQDACHIAGKSKCNIEIDLDLVPNIFGSELSLELKCRFFAGGDDYQLLFCAPKEARSRLEGINGICRIGNVLPADSDKDNTVYVVCGAQERIAYDKFLGNLGISTGYRHFKS
jgi:thiamine-monophosphate kinase